MSWVITIIALPRESVWLEVGGVSGDVSSEEEDPASASGSGAEVKKAVSPDKEFLCVDGPEGNGDLSSSSAAPRFRTFSSTAGFLPIARFSFSSGLFNPFFCFPVFLLFSRIQ